MTTSGSVPRRRHREARGVDDVGLDRDRRPAEAVPQLVAPRCVRPAEIDVSRHRRLPLGGRSAGGERHDLDADLGERGQESVDVPTDPTRHRLEQLADVKGDLHATRTIEADKVFSGRGPREASRVRTTARDERRRADVSSPRTCWSAPASSSSAVGSTSAAASPRTSGSEPAAVGDDRDACRHRLERREPEALVARRVCEHGCAGEQVASLRVGHVPEAHDAAAVVRGVEGARRTRPGPSRRDPRRRGGRRRPTPRPRRTRATRPGTFLRGSIVPSART